MSARCSFSRVTQQQWKLDPAAGNLVPALQWAGRRDPRGQGSEGLPFWLLTLRGKAGVPGCQLRLRLELQVGSTPSEAESRYSRRGTRSQEEAVIAPQNGL